MKSIVVAFDSQVIYGLQLHQDACETLCESVVNFAGDSVSLFERSRLCGTALSFLGKAHHPQG